MKLGRVEGFIDFSDMSGGIVNAYPPHSLESNQVADALNLLFEKRGCSRAPGYTGISFTALFAGPVRGFWEYLKQDGTTAYIVAAESKLWSVSFGAGTRTELAALSNDLECKAVNSYGKLWVVNGVDMYKIESNLSVYRIGLVAPTGFTQSGTAVAGTLAAGAYDTYAAYGRDVSGTLVLVSDPFHIGSVTVDGSHAIRIAATASTDPQVNKIVIYSTEAGGSTLYQFWVANNATGNIDITSNAQKNVSLLMYEQSAGNQVPAALTGIYPFDGRLIGRKASSNILYYTRKAQNVYDLEKWSTEFNIPTIPYNILSFHGINGHLYINTVGGFYVFVNGDLSAKPQQVILGVNTQLLYFPENNLATVKEYNGSLYGLTNDGVRIFDGQNFSPDLSKHVKPTIDTIMHGSTDFMPCAAIYRRPGKRTEYRISYRDKELSLACQNRQIVLNLDKLQILNASSSVAPWEIWSPGFSHAITTISGLLYVAQSSDNASVIATESGNSDTYTLDENANFLSVQTAKTISCATRTVADELTGQYIWFKEYHLAKLMANISCNLRITDKDNYFEPYSIIKTGGNKALIVKDAGSDLFLPFVLPVDNPSQGLQKFSLDAKGTSVSLSFSQTAIDDNFFIYILQLYTMIERNMFT